MSRSRLWNLGTVGVVVVVFLFSWFLLISPKQSEAASLKEETDAVADANQATQAQIRQLEEQQKNLPQQYADLEEIAQLIPATPQLPDLIRQLTDAGANASVVVTGIQPGSITSVPGVSGVVYIPLTLNATGSFADVKSFLYELQMNKRAILVTDISVRREDAVPDENGNLPTGPTQLSVDVTTRVYMTKEAAAAADPAAAGAGATPTAGATAGATPAATESEPAAPANADPAN